MQHLESLSSVTPSHDSAEAVKCREAKDDKILQSPSTQSIVCRICRMGSLNGNVLIQCPCLCRGTIGNVHRNCLTQWKKVQRRNSCEVCNAKYQTFNSENSLWTRRLQRIFKDQYLGFALRRILYILSLWPILRFNFESLHECLDKITPDQDMPIAIPFLFIAFHIFATTYTAWTIKIMLNLKSLIENWWNDIDEDDENDGNGFLFSTTSLDLNLFNIF